MTASAPMQSHPTQDWTAGAAKWAAVLVLGAASIGGMAWSITRRVPDPRLASPPAASTVAEPTSPAPPASSDEPPSASKSPAKPAAAAVTRTINVNTATQAELELLPGIGPALAQRIIDYRSAHGRFTSVSELGHVRGIGPKTLEKLRPIVRLDSAEQQ